MHKANNNWPCQCRTVIYASLPSIAVIRKYAVAEAAYTQDTLRDIRRDFCAGFQFDVSHLEQAVVQHCLQGELQQEEL